MLKKISVKSHDIINIVYKQGYNWKQSWNQTIAIIQNQINQYLYDQTTSTFTKMPTSDVLSIFSDPHLKILIIYFSDTFMHIKTKIDHSQIIQFNQQIELIDRDFSCLGFQIHFDIPRLIHYMPRSPQLITFNDFGTDFTSSPSLTNSNQNKQLRWVQKTFFNNQFIAKYDYIYDSLIVQMTYYQSEWYVLVPNQQTTRISCFNQSLLNQLAEKGQFQNSHIIIEEIRKLLLKINLSFELLDITKSYTFRLSSQLLSNFPINNETIQIMYIYDINSFNLNSGQIQSQFDPIQVQNQFHNQCKISAIQDILNNKSDISLLYVNLSIYDSFNQNLVYDFLLSTQLLLFYQQYKQYLKMIKTRDCLDALKSMIQVCKADNIEKKVFQRVKYQISNLFLSTLQDRLCIQQQHFEIWFQTLKPSLQKLKTAQLQHILKQIQQSSIQYTISHQSKPKQQLIQLICDRFQENNTFSIGEDQYYKKYIQPAL